MQSQALGSLSGRPSVCLFVCPPVSSVSQSVSLSLTLPPPPLSLFPSLPFCSVYRLSVFVCLSGWLDLKASHCLPACLPECAPLPAYLTAYPPASPTAWLLACLCVYLSSCPFVPSHNAHPTFPTCETCPVSSPMPLSVRSDGAAAPFSLVIPLTQSPHGFTAPPQPLALTYRIVVPPSLFPPHPQCSPHPPNIREVPCWQFHACLQHSLHPCLCTVPRSLPNPQHPLLWDLSGPPALALTTICLLAPPSLFHSPPTTLTKHSSHVRHTLPAVIVPASLRLHGAAARTCPPSNLRVHSSHPSPTHLP